MNLHCRRIRSLGDVVNPGTELNSCLSNIFWSSATKHSRENYGEKPMWPFYNFLDKTFKLSSLRWSLTNSWDPQDMKFDKLMRRISWDSQERIYCIGWKVERLINFTSVSLSPQMVLLERRFLWQPKVPNCCCCCCCCNPPWIFRNQNHTTNTNFMEK